MPKSLKPSSKAPVFKKPLALNCLKITGDQPFVLIDGDKSYYLLVNGEIYNYKKLAEEYQINLSSYSSDCSIILELYKRLSYDIVELNKKLNVIVRN